MRDALNGVLEKAKEQASLEFRSLVLCQNALAAMLTLTRILDDGECLGQLAGACGPLR